MVTNEKPAPAQERLIVHGGHHDTRFMQMVRDWFGVQSDFEVGSRAGLWLVPVTCATISVDPQLLIETNLVGTKPSLQPFQMARDAFFARHSPSALLGGPIDMAFLDGLHIFEYLFQRLKDFYRDLPLLKTREITTHSKMARFCWL